jgi:hypothetical protein
MSRTPTDPFVERVRKYDYPETVRELAAECQTLRLRLIDGGPPSWDACKLGPEIVDGLWDAMRRIGGRVPPKPLVKAMRLPPSWTDDRKVHGDFEAFNRAVDVVVRWCDRRQRVIQESKPGLFTADPDKGVARRVRIPSSQRTRPMTLAEAARLMGYKGDRQSVTRQLKAAINAGAVRGEKRNRQSYIFDRNDFPEESQQKTLPSQPN